MSATAGASEWWNDTSVLNATLMRPDISLEDSQELYRKWSESGTYDKVISSPTIGLPAAMTALADGVTEVIKDQQALILDVGAGTGLVGDMLHDMGYTNLHALEPQSGFAQTSRSKGKYCKVLEEFIGGDGQVSVDDDTYDAVVSNGAFGPGHIPTSAILEMVRIVKPGGHVIVSLREEFLRTVPDYDGKLEALWDRLEAEGKWQRVRRLIYPHHYGDKDGLAITYRIC